MSQRTIMDFNRDELMAILSYVYYFGRDISEVDAHVISLQDKLQTNEQEIQKQRATDSVKFLPILMAIAYALSSLFPSFQNGFGGIIFITTFIYSLYEIGRSKTSEKPWRVKNIIISLFIAISVGYSMDYTSGIPGLIGGVIGVYVFAVVILPPIIKLLTSNKQVNTEEVDSSTKVSSKLQELIDYRREVENELEIGQIQLNALVNNESFQYFLSLIPENFRTFEDLLGMLALLQDFRASNFQEAANIWRTEQHQQKLQAQQENMLVQLDAQLENNATYFEELTSTIETLVDEQRLTTEELEKLNKNVTWIHSRPIRVDVEVTQK